MSTNYYLRTDETRPDDEGVHLGKWSVDEFTARAYPEHGVADRASWEAQLNGGQVVSEYGVPIAADEIVEKAITRPAWGRSAHPRGGEFYDGGIRFLDREFC
jgi:hypothetical protein